MSLTVKKILLIALVLVMSCALWGCGGGGGGGLSQEQIDQIIASAIAANGQVETAQFDMNLVWDLESVGGSEPGALTMALDVTGVMDFAGEEMQMAGEVTVEVPGQDKLVVPMASYITGGWQYTISGQGEEWLKTELTLDIWAGQSQVSQQIEFLKTAVEINYSGSETLNGVDCYVFQIVPSTEALLSLLSQQQQTTGYDFSQLDIAKLIKDMSVKEWIAKDSRLVMKAADDVVMEMSPGDIGASGADYTKMTIKMTVAVNLHDHNQPVSIELPPEALSAQEAS